MDNGTEPFQRDSDLYLADFLSLFPFLRYKVDLNIMVERKIIFLFLDSIFILITYFVGK